MIRIALFSFILLSVVGCKYNGGSAFYWQDNNEQAQNDLQRGFNNFLYSDFGGFNGEALENNAVIPWEVATGALLFNRSLTKENLQSKLKESGFLYPTSIRNAPGGITTVRHPDAPMGIVRGILTSDDNLPNLQAGLIGCAMCHSSHGYDSQGRPKLNEIWLGDSSSSINAERFIDEIYQGYQNAISNRRGFRRFMQQEFGRTESTGWFFLNQFLDIVEEGLEEFESLDRGTPASNGGAALTNGVAALKNYAYGYHNIEEFYSFERGFTSIPPVFDRHLRSSLLYDGLYSAIGIPSQTEVRASQGLLSAFQVGQIVSFFTIPTLSNTPERAAETFGLSEDVVKYFKEARRERFPGGLDQSLVREGRTVYRQSCQECHGSYNNSLTQPTLVSFPNKISPISEIGTDRVRLDVIDQRLMNHFAQSSLTDHVAVNKNNGYVAPLLSQIWKSAPYLHNGSVPSLAALAGLEERPTQFYVGGHSLDFQTMGVSYPSGYLAWSAPSLYDTRERGKSNSGHESEFRGLSNREKWAVIEYLKLL